MKRFGVRYDYPDEFSEVEPIGSRVNAERLWRDAIFQHRTGRTLGWPSIVWTDQPANHLNPTWHALPADNHPKPPPIQPGEGGQS